MRTSFYWNIVIHWIASSLPFPTWSVIAAVILILLLTEVFGGTVGHSIYYNITGIIQVLVSVAWGQGQH